MPDIEIDEAVRRKVRRYGQRRNVCDLALLAGALLLIWSGLFLSTYHYPFYWDDFHQIRPYSWNELLSALHGWSDPDKLETPAFRPLATFLFAIQGSVFGENMVFQRIFMTSLMEILLVVLGLFLLELRLDLFQMGIVFLKYVGNPGNSHPLLHLRGSCGLFFSHLDETSSHRACSLNVHVRGRGRVDPRRGLRSAVGTAASVVDVAASMEKLARHVSSGARRPHNSRCSFCIAKHFRAGGTPGPTPRLHHPQIENALNFDRIILAPRRS